MKAYQRTKTPPTQMVECEVSEELIRNTPFDSEYYTLVESLEDADAAYDRAEALETETGFMHIAKGWNVYRELSARTLGLQ